MIAILDVCPHCAAEVPPGQHFCPSCGGALGVVCPVCGATPPPGRFCGSCGSPLPTGTPTDVAPVASLDAAVAAAAVTERRIPSVLFADLVGFTTLSEHRDPEEVRELLSRYFATCRKIIGRYGGVVEKFIGDAVMAVWGVPVAHEDDAERAVRAGLELVDAVAALGGDLAVPELALRVGVVTGEVAVTVGATAEGMVAGDAVNTASRVQSAAAPGEVLVDEATRSLSSSTVLFESTGAHSLKGKAEPVPLWRARCVVAEVGGERFDGLEAPLTGRERELRLVKELFHATEESGRPRLVVLDGDAGMGKSRLAWELEKYVDGLSTRVMWHRSRCLSYGDGVAFWALADVIRNRLRLVDVDDLTLHPDEALDVGLAAVVRDQEEREWMRPRLAALLTDVSGEQLARESLFTAWTTFFERVGDGRPVVLVIDDAQHADNGLLDFLEHLLSSARAAIFVLLLARPELLRRRPDLGGRRASVIRLGPLDDAAMGRLVDALVSSLPPGARAVLVERAEGVPLFAVETVRALIDRDAVVPRHGRYVAADDIEAQLHSIGAPASLHALVAARLDALTPDERHVVNDASVLGLSFSRDGLAALAPAGLDLDTVLAALRRKEIFSLVTDRFSGERGQHRFVQNVVRQVAYAGLSHRDRKTRHLAAADHLAGEEDAAGELVVVIAQHLLDAVAVSSSTDADVPHLLARARELLETAARRSRRLGSPTEALRLNELALTHCATDSDRARVELAAAECAADASEHEIAISHARRASALYDALGEPIAAAAAAAVHAWSLVRMADNSAAIDVAEPRWRQLDATPGAERALLGLARCLALAHSMLGHGEVHAGYVQRTLLLSEALGDPLALAEGLNEMGAHLCLIGAPVAGLALLHASADTARRHDLHEQLAIALINVAVFGVSRTLEDAVAAGRESLKAARRCGVRHRIDLAAADHLLALWSAGHLAEARTVLTEASESAVDQTSRIVLAAVERWLDEATGLPVPPPPDLEAGDSETNRAWLANIQMLHALHTGDAAEAARLAADGIVHVLAAMGIEDDFLHLWPPMVAVVLEAGDIPLAERLLEPVTSAPPGVVSPAVVAQLHRLRGLVRAARGDDPVAVEDDLQAGIAALDDYGAVGIAGRAREELARWLVRQHRGEEAVPLLAAARRAYDEIGANGWLAQLDALDLVDTAVG